MATANTGRLMTPIVHHVVNDFRRGVIAKEHIALVVVGKEVVMDADPVRLWIGQ